MTDNAPSFERVQSDPNTGLGPEQVQARMEAGAHNAPTKGVTPSVGKIILKNVCTLFNLINLLLALAILLVGEARNALFFGVALCNTALGIFQELRAKRTLDKLSILARGKVAAIRSGAQVHLEQNEVVLDDILLLAAGGQVCADAVVVADEGLEVDESLLTGESDPIRKRAGDAVLSGSCVVAGSARVRVTAVGRHSYAGALAVQAKQEKKPKTQLMRTLNNIIRVLAIAIIPVGLLLFATQYNSSGELDASVLGAAAAMIGMIPEGLMLLTGVTLTVGALKLARRRALVQSLYSIETLARSDVLCLDKTGTITDGTLSFERLVPFEGVTPDDMGKALGAMMKALSDDNATARALRATFAMPAAHTTPVPVGAGPCWAAEGTVPFSSARKWSAAAFTGQGCYVLGAPTFVLPGDALQETVAEYTAQGYRVLCLAHSKAALPDDGLPGGLACLGLVVLSDTVRPEAPDTFRFFENEGVELKVISGDDARTASTIARKAGITGAEKYVDLSEVPPDTDYGLLARQYTVFGRVTPEQKKALVAAMKKDGHTVCMTGDGVNDVLAMKEADCGVAMIGGSEAARGAADFVLMTSDFSAMVDVLREGRRVINNIEKVASLYLVKTIYSTILSLLYVFIPYPYPFAPLQMTPMNALMVGIPSFLLALRGNYIRPKGRFLANILELSAPAALVVVANILIIQVLGILFGLKWEATSTMNVLLTGTVGLCMLYQVAKPLRKRELALLCLVPLAFVAAFQLFGGFFMLQNLFTRDAQFYLPLLVVTPVAFFCLTRFARWLGKRSYLRKLSGSDPAPWADL